MYSIWKTKLYCNHIRFTNLVEGSWFDSTSEDANNTKTSWFPFVKVLLSNFWCNFCWQWTPWHNKTHIWRWTGCWQHAHWYSYDKAIRGHFLIDAAILQHVIPASTFTGNELSLLKTIILDCSEDWFERQSNGGEIQMKDQKCTDR